jgi:hypothetical protein
MAYYTGTVNDMTALRQALIDSCVNDGWAWDGGSEVLSKDTMFLRLQVVSGYLTLLGRTGAGVGSAPSALRIGTIAGVPISFPMQYEVFAFAGEVYMVVNYGVDYYQWCAFGKSTVEGLPGSGMWVGASAAAGFNGNVDIAATTGGSNSASYSCPALFWRTSGAQAASSANYWLHSDLDGQGWILAQDINSVPVGISASAPFIGILPNSWNSEAVLLPVRCYKFRASNKVSLVADLEHSRYTRIDNYAPGEIITIGSDRWKVFPCYRKNTAARNGGASIGHTGTFGWAIRYEGP